MLQCGSRHLRVTRTHADVIRFHCHQRTLEDDHLQVIPFCSAAAARSAPHMQHHLQQPDPSGPVIKMIS